MFMFIRSAALVLMLVSSSGAAQSQQLTPLSDYLALPLDQQENSYPYMRCAGLVLGAKLIAGFDKDAPSNLPPLEALAWTLASVDLSLKIDALAKVALSHRLKEFPNAESTTVQLQLREEIQSLAKIYYAKLTQNLSDPTSTDDGSTCKLFAELALDATSNPVDSEVQADVDAPAAALPEASPEPQEPPKELPINQAGIAGLSSAINECLNTSNMSDEVLNTSVGIQFEMSEDAKPNVQSIKMMSFSGGSLTSAQIAFQVARTAIVLCGQNGYGLDPSEYGEWAVMNMTIDSNGMRLR
ncbi:hypothetical protein [Cypionkella sp.]|uniref:hypothetical protein n=1 Tax=Cypionkella sp. TaxID=2811411 RepID=UPI0037527380